MIKFLLPLAIFLALASAYPGNHQNRLHHGVRPHLRTSRTLQSDIDEIMALIPISEITTIGLNYLANDEEVQKAMAYLQSAEFHEIVKTIDENAEYILFLSFLIQYGVDPYPVVNQFHELIGMEPITPPPMTRRHSRSIKSMFDEIVAIIPLDEIKALVAKKLVESPEFKALYDKIGSPEFQSIVTTLQGLPEYQLMKEKLIGYGIDVEAIIQYFRDLFGLPASVSAKSARSLQSDIDEIMALIPISEISTIGLNYLANDEEVQKAMAYLQSAEFHAIVKTIDENAEYILFLSFLIQYGVDPYPVVNQFHELIGMEPITPPPMTRRHSRSIKSMFDEIVAIIPLDEIKALVAKKLVESPEFKALYDKIGSPEFQSIVTTLQGLPEYQLMKEKLIGYGIDVQAIIQYFKDLFGLP